jgi:hypothetical protein
MGACRVACRARVARADRRSVRVCIGHVLRRTCSAAVRTTLAPRARASMCNATIAARRLSRGTRRSRDAGVRCGRAAGKCFVASPPRARAPRGALRRSWCRRPSARAAFVLFLGPRPFARHGRCGGAHRGAGRRPLARVIACAPGRARSRGDLPSRPACASRPWSLAEPLGAGVSVRRVARRGRCLGCANACALTRVAADKTAREISVGVSSGRAVLQQNPVSLERVDRSEWSESI